MWLRRALLRHSGFEKIAVAHFPQAHVLARPLEVCMGRHDLFACAGDEDHGGSRTGHRILPDGGGEPRVEPGQRQCRIQFRNPGSSLVLLA